MGLTQQKFLNASISTFSCNGGWGSTPSTLTVELVEDESNSDYLLAPPVNTPVYFWYDGWGFDGILTNIGPKYGENGNPIVEVILTDPRVFLDGVQLILDGYTGGVFNVPNLYNIYGHLESFGFGNAGRNELGIPWLNVFNSLTALTTAVPIEYNGYKYFLDLKELPRINPYYRITSENLSLMGFIQEICDIANYDFAIDLVGNVIFLRVINRGRRFTSGAINRFVSNTPGSVSRNIGVQSEYNLTNRFVIGGKVEQLFYNSCFTPGQLQEIGAGDQKRVELVKKTMKDINTPFENICQYWGLRPNGDAIFGFIDEQGRYAVTVDGHPITYAVSDRETRREGEFVPRDFIQGYTFTIPELRASLISQQSWEAFISLNDYEGNGFYHGLVNRLRMRGEIGKDAKKILGERENFNDVNMFEFINIAKAKNEEDEIYLNRVYNFVKHYAEEYFGRKFMVRIPFTLAKMNEVQEVVTSYEIADSGFVEESNYQLQAVNNLLPFDFDFVTDSDGKVTPFVRYDGSQYDDLDLSELSQEDYFIGNGRKLRDKSITDNPETPEDEQIRLVESLFVRCDVEEKIIFVRRAAAFSPRAVITLPAPIYYSDQIGEGQNARFIIETVFNNLLAKAAEEEDDEEVEKIEKLKQKRFPGADNMTFGGSAEPVKPDLAAIPLRNTLLNYGPWYTDNPAGKTEFINNDSLVPWNFGGFTGMAQAGLSIANNSFGATLQAEGGSVDVPGAPLIQIGRELTGGGPFITNIQVSITEGGVVTNYQMNRSSLRNGDNSNFIVENMKRMFEIRKQLNEERKRKRLQRPRLSKNERIRLNNKFPRRNQSNSSSTMILGSVDKKSEENIFDTNVAIMPAYTITDSYDNDEWENTYGISLNALFRPFSTNSETENVPTYNEASEIAPSPNLSDLNPYKQGHDIDLIFNSDDPEEVNIRKKYEGGAGIDYRGLALKGPLVVAGWGYDVGGLPVPADPDDSNEFLEDYLRRSDQWKVGPVDLRWDDSRGVWAAGGVQVIEGVLTSHIDPPVSSDSPTTFTISVRKGEDWVSSDETVTCYNRDTSLSIDNYEDILVIAMFINGQWRPIWVGCENG